MTAPTLAPEALRRILGLPFTDEQLASITAPTLPSVVIAGAGSGKTAVMSARVVWLVASGVGAPETVLGLTFTNKAAAELAQRVRRALDLLAMSGHDVPDGEPTVSTYHAYAASLLREYGLRAGYEPAARLLADAARFQLAERVVRRTPGPFAALRMRVSDLTRAVVSLDGELNEHLVDPAAVLAHDAALHTAIDAAEQLRGTLTQKPLEARQAAHARAELLELVLAYRADKQRLDVVDFGDQMAGAARLAESFPDVGASERERYTAVLLDEYQDTSIAQKRLLLGLFGTGYAVTAVGDPFQAIYGWRGASVRNITSFAHEFSPADTVAPVFSLTQNNRSGERILDLANVVADPLRSAHPQVAPLRPRADQVAQGVVNVGLYPSRDDEIDAMGDDIVRRIDDGTEPNEIAVLCRDSASFAALHAAFTARDVPVEVVGLGGLLELPEIVDLVSTLEVLDDPSANPAMLRLLTGPRWRIGPRDLALLGDRAKALVAERSSTPGDLSLAQALLDAVAGIDPAEVISLAEAVHDPGEAPYSSAARQRFAQLDAELATLRRHRGELLPDLVRRVLDVTGLAVEVSANPHAVRSRRPEQLASFVSQVAAFADLDGSATLGAFLAFLDASVDYEGGLDSASPSATNTVKVMTVHKAKGLEWEVVYLPFLCETVFPSGRGRSLWTSSASVLPYSLRGDAADYPTVNDWSGNKGCEEFRQQMRDKDLVEERRLAYVAFTRAKRVVVASGHWWGPTQKKRRGPSDYLTRAHEFCAAGGGQVLHWEAEPDADAGNPALLDVTPTPWPVTLDRSAADQRQLGASLVHAAMSGGVTPAGTPAEPAEAERVARWDADLAALLAEAEELHEQDRTVTLPAKLSASSLVRLTADPGGLAQDLARPMPRRPAPAARRGTSFHAWVESLFGQATLIDLDEFDDAPPPGEADDLAPLQDAFRSGPFRDRAPVAVEAPFQLVLGGRVVSGRIDAVYERPDDPTDPSDPRYEVVDWKTGQSVADPMQLAIYRVAWAELHGVPVEKVTASFYYVSRGEVHTPTDLPDREALTALIESAGAYPASV